jgi:carboxymethylenebutenolidase
MAQHQVKGRWEPVDVGDKSMDVYVCAPLDMPRAPGVIVIQEIFGVNHHIRAVVERIAREGYVVCAPDVFHRQETRYESTYADMTPGFERMNKLRDEDFLRDTKQLLRWMRGQREIVDRIGVTGFCMGGRLTFLTACTHPISAAAAFYGAGTGQLLGKAKDLTCPLLAFFGQDDPFIPASEVKAVEDALTVANKSYEIKAYPGAGHGFFCDERGSYHKPSADEAWRRLTDFFGRHLRDGV